MKPLIIICAGILSGLFYAVTLQAHWSWFVSPLGAPVIGMAHAYGLVLLIKLAVTRMDLPVKDQEWFEILLGPFVMCLISLGLGKVAHAFMMS